MNLGHDDMAVTKARAILGPQAVIGVSCHASRDLAIEAAEAGADYVAFGAFYPTTSKPQEKIAKWGVPRLDILEWWSSCAILPCVAIGGITPQNCAPLVAAGADFLAAITSVWSHPKGPAAAVREFVAALEKN
jgi:thiamine-phosphate pyrophosphorylase